MLESFRDHVEGLGENMWPFVFRNDAQNWMILRHKSDLTQKLKTVLSSRRELTLDCRKRFQSGGFFDDVAGDVRRSFFLGFLMVTLDDGGHQRAFQGA